MRTKVESPSFSKDKEKLSRQGKNINLLESLITLIMSGQRIPEIHKPHKLKNSKDYKQCLECHVTSPTDDWVVVYKIYKDKRTKDITVVFLKTGTHTYVFKESLERQIL